MIQSDGQNQHIFRLASDTANKTQITSGPVDVTKIYGVRPNQDYGPGYAPFGWVVMFQAAPTSDTRHIYALNLNYGRDAYYKVKSYPVEYQLPEVDPSKTPEISGAWYCFTCLSTCWQGGSNCHLDIFDYTGEQVREKRSYYDMKNPDLSGGNTMAMVTCSGPSVPYQFFISICQHTENFYPWDYFYVPRDNYQLEEDLESV